MGDNNWPAAPLLLVFNEKGEVVRTEGSAAGISGGVPENLKSALQMLGLPSDRFVVGVQSKTEFNDGQAIIWSAMSDGEWGLWTIPLHLVLFSAKGLSRILHDLKNPIVSLRQLEELNMGEITDEELLTLQSLRPEYISKVENALKQIERLLVGKKEEHKEYNKEVDLSVLTVAVVDDDPVMQKVFRLMLESRVKKLSVFSTGKELLTYLQIAGQKVDLILTDLFLQDEDGKQLCRRVNFSGIDPPPRVMVVSGAAELSEEGAFLANGFSGLLSKPFKIEGLLNTIDRVFRRSDEEIDERIKEYLLTLPVSDKAVLSKLEELVGLESLQELIVSFQEEVEYGLSLINMDETSHNKKEIFRTLHTWKSSSSTLGFQRLECYCGFLEIKCFRKGISREEFIFLRELLNETDSKP